MSSRHSCQRNLLIESCGHVYFVCFFYEFITTDRRREEISAIRVFELDSCQFVWKEINSLDGRSFFLGYKSSSWCWGNTNSNDPESGSGIQSNCVYFLLPNHGNQSLCSFYIYNLIDQTFMHLRSCPDLLMPRDPPVWLIPQHQRLLSKNKIIKKVDHPQQCRQGVLMHNEGQEQQTRFMELPAHMIECISKSMHLFEYWNFRASCKEIRSLCPAP